MHVRLPFVNDVFQFGERPGGVFMLFVGGHVNVDVIEREDHVELLGGW